MSLRPWTRFPDACSGGATLPRPAGYAVFDCRRLGSTRPGRDRLVCAPPARRRRPRVRASVISFVVLPIPPSDRRPRISDDDVAHARPDSGARAELLWLLDGAVSVATTPLSTSPCSGTGSPPRTRLQAARRRHARSRRFGARAARAGAQPRIGCVMSTASRSRPTTRPATRCDRRSCSADHTPRLGRRRSNAGTQPRVLAPALARRRASRDGTPDRARVRAQATPPGSRRTRSSSSSPVSRAPPTSTRSPAKAGAGRLRRARARQAA